MSSRTTSGRAAVRKGFTALHASLAARVVRDFDEVYSVQHDPWAIGAANSERYGTYRDTILEHASSRDRLLDIGCGYGAFLARFRDDFSALHGIEVAQRAVEGGQRRYPFISFRQGSADRLSVVYEDDPGQFDCIIYSDVINYLTERGKHRSLDWIAERLSPDGLGFVAAWSPGGRYLTVDELRALVGRHLVIEAEQILETQHALFACRKAAPMVALTVDHETWQPIPPGRKIDWAADILEPTTRLLDTADRRGVPITLMAEMGEWLWLEENDTTVAAAIAAQWRDALDRGHDVQLHLHPAWLPELGARREEDGWAWNLTHSRAADYPGDLAALMKRCKGALESAVRDRHEVICFRAGAYEAQPFARLADALAHAAVSCDSSVLPGGPRPGRSFDYSAAPKAPSAWYASPWDPQLPAPSAERRLVELPIWTVGGQRWTFDGSEGRQFVDRLLNSRSRRLTGFAPPGYRWSVRVARTVQDAVLARPAITRRLPRRLIHAAVDTSTPLRPAYHVLVGHSKSDLDIEAIDHGLARLANSRFRTVTLSSMAHAAHMELERRAEQETNESAASSPVNDRVTEDLLGHVPLDRARVHQLAGTPSTGWRRWPWVAVGSGPLPDRRGQLDCIVADRTLELERDPQAVLEQAANALAEGGVLVAAVHASAANLDAPCPEHPWRTNEPDVRARLEAAGFARVTVEALDALRLTGRVHPPSGDLVLLVRAWRGPGGLPNANRLTELVRWSYERLDPVAPAAGSDALEILAGGRAWCAGATSVLGEALRREGFDVRWVTMVARDHPCGRGPDGEDSHEVLDIRLPDGSRHVADPSTGVVFSEAIESLVARPELATPDREPDDRWGERRYELYGTSYWYERIDRVAMRASLSDPHRFVSAHRLRRGTRTATRARRAEPRPLRLARRVWRYGLAPRLRRSLNYALGLRR